MEAKRWIDSLADGKLKESLLVSWYHGAVAENPSMAPQLFSELPEHARGSGLDPLIESIHRDRGMKALLDWFETPPCEQPVPNTDADREFAYDRDSHVGKLAEALDEAPQRGWSVVDMKNNWKTVYPD